jgi:hypothetical protein
MCPEAYWKGNCGWIGPIHFEVCFQLPFPHSQEISFGPDPDVICTLFTTQNCEAGKAGTQTKESEYPGSELVPGPAYQGGQDTIYGPAYRAYICERPSERRQHGSADR